MQIETLPIDRLIPYARNSRTHSDAQVAQIAASIREFGFTNPVLIDGEGGIIAGHGRVMGARQLGLADVPCIRLGHLTDAQRRAYVIADNNIAINSGWDEDLLAAELSDLLTLGYDTEILGFEMDTEALIADLRAPSGFEKSLPTNFKEDDGEVVFKNLAKYPVTMILDEDEHKEWEAMKEKRGCGDKKLMLDLLRGKK